jgi:phosphate/sulfate permease
MFGLSTGLAILLILCILAALLFEFINGFHDTANAVATVIFTRSLKPGVAVVWSGFMNFLGVYIGGIAVAMGIVNLLPTNILVDQNIYHALAMILALIITAIIWNLGTWWLGLPCSSSHTLIGSIFGVGLAFSFLPGSQGAALNWHKVQEVLLSLLISPVIGFGVSFGLVVLLKALLGKDHIIFQGSKHKKRPPLWIRSILILTCTSVSFSHGSNDGQKGVGLIMIILISILPFQFAIDKNKDLGKLQIVTTNIENCVAEIDTTNMEVENKASLYSINQRIDQIQKILTVPDTKKISKENLTLLRKEILLLSKEFDKISRSDADRPKIELSSALKAKLKNDLTTIKSYTAYAPKWVIILISLALGLGTMVGWKRIVMTIGTKIGKTPLNYAQGASSELVAASTIGISSMLGLPVSTTHVLSSGIAGSMVAKKRKGNLKVKTIRNIAIAWLVTLPFTIIASGSIFYGLWYLLK